MTTRKTSTSTDVDCAEDHLTNRVDVLEAERDELLLKISQLTSALHEKDDLAAILEERYRERDSALATEQLKVRRLMRENGDLQVQLSAKNKLLTDKSTRHELLDGVADVKLPN